MNTEGPSAPAFDRWLNRQLHELYDSIACAPLPGDLIALIERSAASPDRGDKAIDQVV